MSKIIKESYSVVLVTTLCLIILFFMVGCAPNIKNISNDYRASSDKGVVILSLTASGECGYAYFLNIRSIDGKTERTIGMQEAFKERDWKRKNTDNCSLDETSYVGRLSVIELPPGTYEIHKISGISRFHSFESADKFTLRFKVNKKSIKYIGNAHFFVTKNTYSFKTQNMQNRDIKLFYTKYPSLKNRDIVLDLLKEIQFLSA